MKRRDFLKMLGAVPVVAAVPALANNKNNGWFDQVKNSKPVIAHNPRIKIGDRIFINGEDGGEFIVTGKYPE